MINTEYVVDIARLAHEHSLKVIAVTNGFIRDKLANFLSDYVDAANVDFKGDKEFYRKYCDARQTPVKRTIENWVDNGVHVEITTLVIPTLNDQEGFIRTTAKWIAERLGTDIVWHFSRFFPMYKLQDKPITPLKTLLRCKEIAREEGIKYVYIGNVGNEVDDNTYCESCGKVLVKRGFGFNFLRKGYKTNISTYDPKSNSCSHCGAPAPFNN